MIVATVVSKVTV